MARAKRKNAGQTTLSVTVVKVPAAWSPHQQVPDSYMTDPGGKFIPVALFKKELLFFSPPKHVLFMDLPSL